MIYAIAAMDNKRGIATDAGIPWKLPSDVRYFRDKTENNTVLMGKATYEEFSAPLSSRRNLVASRHEIDLRTGFELVNDVENLLKTTIEDVWVIGGAGLFAQTLDLIDELYLTKVEGDFNCTKFFPDYENDFELVSESEPQTENGTSFTFCVYKRK